MSQIKMWHWVLQSVKASKERKKIISCQRSLKQNRVEKHNLQGAEKLIRCQQMLKLNAGEKHKLVQSTEKLIRWLIRCQRLLKLNRVEKHKVAQSAEKLIRWLIRCQWLPKVELGAGEPTSTASVATRLRRSSDRDPGYLHSQLVHLEQELYSDTEK